MTYFTYVFPCVWEDHCKVGFSRDPLSRLQAFHRRWFEFFDLDRIVLVESDREREARDLELALRRPLKIHRAPMPLTILRRAGGHTEWLRGSSALLEERRDFLHQGGYRLETQPRAWLAHALESRSDGMFAWSCHAFPDDDAGTGAHTDRSAALIVDTLDAYTALGLDVASILGPQAYRWYCGRSDLLASGPEVWRTTPVPG